MKNTVLGLIALLSLNSNAQKMETPIDAVTQLFIATDKQDWPQVEKIFDSSVQLDYSSMNGKPTADLSAKDIIDSWKTILPGFKHTHHQLGNFQVSTNANTAHVFCYGTATHYLENEQGNVWTVVGSYDFDLRKDENELWRITSMTFNFKYMGGNTSLPEKAMNKLK